MQNIQSEIAESVDSAIRNLFRQFGRWAVLRALLSVMLLQRQKTNDLGQLSDRMLRDIGADFREDVVRPKGFSIWDIRP